jgi:16S rRNA (guanine966-N2)-methyltransferase
VIPHRKYAKPATDTRRPRADGPETELRIIGGQFRGRRLRYHGDPIVRPMKHRTREAIFNLVTTEAEGHHAIDLFAGTGALGLEAISRGAVSGTFIEKHVPSARMIEENIRTLGVDNRATLLTTSAFLWAKRDLAGATPASPPPDMPWIVFCCPPYAFFVDRLAEMLELIRRIQVHAPADSVFIIEADQRFDFALLNAETNRDQPGGWDIRTYPPAVVGIWRA